MDKDKSILEKITGTMKDIANIAADAADHAMKANEAPPKADERSAAYIPLAADGRFRSHDGPADCGCSRSAKEARRLEAGGKGRQQDSSKEGRREIRGEAREENRSREVKEHRQNGREENQQENGEESAQGKSLTDPKRRIEAQFGITGGALRRTYRTPLISMVHTSETNALAFAGTTCSR